MERKDAESVGDILRQYLKITQIENHTYEVEIARVWQETLGEQITRETDRIHLWSGTLYVDLKSPALKNEILMRRTAIARALNEKMGSEVIKQVVVR